MLIPRFVSMFSIGMMVLGAGVASGQTTSTGSGQAYPNKPVRVVTAAVGGGADFVARLVATGLSGSLGQPVIVDNRATAVVGELVSKAPPDGYTLLVANQFIWMTPLLREAPYDPVKDFSPITVIATSPNILVVHPSVPAKSVKELIAYAKTRSGQLNYASGAPGGSSHLAMELFKAMAGVNIVAIYFQNPGQGINDLLGGQVQMMSENLTTVMPHVKSGKLRALAVTTAQPSALAPGLPTVAASGLPGYEMKSTFGISAPGKTPEAIVNRLNQEIVRVLNRSDVKEKLFDTGAEAVGSSPKEFANQIKSEMAIMGKVIKDAGIKAP